VYLLQVSGCMLQNELHQEKSQTKSHTNSDSKIERGDEEETTEAYILVRRRDDDEVNEVKSMKANWYHIDYLARSWSESLPKPGQRKFLLPLSKGGWEGLPQRFAQDTSTPSRNPVETLDYKEPVTRHDISVTALPPP
jgi:hypothetical protein